MAMPSRNKDTERPRRFSPFALARTPRWWTASSQFGWLPLRAQVKPLRTQVKLTQARNGICLKYAGRAHPSQKLRFAKSRFSQKPIFLSGIDGLRPNALPICLPAVRSGIAAAPVRRTVAGPQPVVFRDRRKSVELLGQIDDKRRDLGLGPHSCLVAICAAGVY